ncbi:hypothetical protein [Escherichia coli]|uniref:hypothetical protein n=1 Tax=Escherichia coli TaxID=562 RepID=UPI001699C824|nr:hypothetical protein [Escherichia coli]EFJ2109268.1 hypothetical protein [Escherichia coli]EFJ3331342.1 hypothetical protein [Escherichia coli]EFN4059224.1 hypothetical protein [Escherichia coli]MCH0611204.1 hypothetical protein [Escherichia coli]MCH0664707.1 hypothetical protein [Escherichia coli]
MSSFNHSSLRSSGSPLRVETTDKEHAIAHEALLVAILTHLARAAGSNAALLELEETVKKLTCNSNPNSLRIASDLINEAKENFHRS